MIQADAALKEKRQWELQLEAANRGLFWERDAWLARFRAAASRLSARQTNKHDHRITLVFLGPDPKTA